MILECLAWDPLEICSRKQLQEVKKRKRQEKQEAASLGRDPDTGNGIRRGLGSVVEAESPEDGDDDETDLDLLEPTFTSMNWYNQLVEYGISADVELSERESAAKEEKKGSGEAGGGGGEDEEEDGDLLLVPKLVESVVLPKVRVLIANAFSPFSATHNKLFLALARELYVHSPSYSSPDIPGKQFAVGAVGSVTTEALHELFNLYHKRLEEVELPLPRSSLLPRHFEQFKEDALPLLLCRFWSCVKLLHNACMWYECAPMAPRALDVVEDILETKVVPFLEASLDGRLHLPLSSCVHMCARVVEGLPRLWLDSYPSGKVPAQLKYFLSGLRKVEDKIKDSKSLEKKEEIECMKKMRDMYMVIKASQDAKEVDKMYSFT